MWIDLDYIDTHRGEMRRVQREMKEFKKLIRKKSPENIRFDSFQKTIRKTNIQ
jgi:hypothetical protein